MDLGARPSILARLGASLVLTLLLALVLALPLAWPAAAAAASGTGPGASALEQRLEQWPAWRLPAPLPRPGRRDLVWPAWFAGEWQVSSLPLETPGGEVPPGGEAPAGAAPQAPAPLRWRARFVDDGHGGVVGERAFNARAIGTALLSDQLLAVQDDPGDPNRQLARLSGDRLLDSRIVGRRSQRLGPDLFLADELSLQVLHGPGEPRISRIETLGRWQRRDDGGIEGEQWQARYASPAEGLATAALSTARYRLRLDRLPPGSDPAS